MRKSLQRAKYLSQMRGLKSLVLRKPSIRALEIFWIVLLTTLQMKVCTINERTLNTRRSGGRGEKEGEEGGERERETSYRL